MIYVDDELVADFDNDKENYGNGQLRYITALSEEQAAHHTVKLVPAPDNSGTDFTIYGWAIGK